VRLAVGLLGALAGAEGARAQSLRQQSLDVRQPAPVEPWRVISANPFLPLLGFFSAEYEVQVQSALSLAFAGSHIKWDGTRFTNLDAKVRFYPQERGLSGMNFAAGLGAARIKDDEDDECATTPCPQTTAFTAPAFSIELGYQRLLGPSRSTAVTAGVGGKRYLGSEERFDSIMRVVPTLRLSIGYAF
jgi:hypothetical protein